MYQDRIREQIRADRARVEISWKDLAEKCGMTDRQLRRKINEGATITLTDLEVIAIALGQDPFAYSMRAQAAA